MNHSSTKRNLNSWKELVMCRQTDNFAKNNFKIWSWGILLPAACHKDIPVPVIYSHLVGASHILSYIKHNTKLYFSDKVAKIINSRMMHIFLNMFFRKTICFCFCSLLFFIFYFDQNLNAKCCRVQSNTVQKISQKAAVD